MTITIILMEYEDVQVVIAALVLIISILAWYTTGEIIPAYIGVVAAVLITTAYLHYKIYPKYNLYVNVCTKCKPKSTHKKQKYCPLCGKKM
jgi:hypothetical protein